MADESQTNTAWKIAAPVLAVIAVAASAIAFMQYRSAVVLGERLAAAIADAKATHSEAANLKAELGAAQAAEVIERQQLSATQQRVSTEQRQLQSIQAQLETESRPDLPVEVTFRSGMSDQGEVAMLRNTSDETLEVILDAQSPTTGAHFRRVLAINGRQVAQFGWQQGWSFEPGQLVTVSHPRFRPKVTTVN